MDNEAVLVQDLVKRYGKVTAVNGISFSVRKGEVFGLLGPNGDGSPVSPLEY
jgi:ABC-2 type transport system ATP-binding protein